MSVPAAPEVRTVAVIGTGVIGAAWVAGFLAAGLDVVATDPADGAEARLRAFVDETADVVAEFTGCDRADRGALRFVATAGEAARAADFVQENGPERLDAKSALLAEIDAAARPGVIIASSTSGIEPSVL